MKRSYHQSFEIADTVFAETSRSNFRRMLRLHLERQSAELEEKVLADWDEAHRGPMLGFASALNTSLAEQRRAIKLGDGHDAQEANDGC